MRPLITWRELTAKVEAKGLMDISLATIHVVLDGPDDLDAIDIFQNIAGTVSVMNSSCSR